MPSPFNARAIYDAFFKDVFADGGRATSFAADHVADLRDRIVGELTPISQLFTDDEHLRETQCDCLFKARMKPADGGADEPGYVFVLFEHKSRPARDVLLQILGYVAAIAKRAAKQGRPPPPVIPLLFYHGREKWRLPRRLDMTFGKSADAPGLVLRVVAVNLNDMDESRLATDPHVHAAFYAMRFCHGALKGGPGLEDALRAIPDESPLTQSIVSYLIGAGKHSRDAVESAVMNTKPEQGAQIMHESFMQFVDQGLAKGRVEGEAKLLTTQLRHKFGPLPPDIRQRLDKATIDELDAWGLKALDAPTLQAVFANSARR